MKKLTILISIIMIFTLALTGCASKTIEIKGITGEIIEVDTSDLSDEQIEALELTASGDYNIMSLMQSGLFTQEQLIEMNLFEENVFQKGDRGDLPEIDYTTISIDDLNIEGLSEVQVNTVKDLLNGVIQLPYIIENNLLTQEELVAIGLIQQQERGQGTNNQQGASNQQGVPSQPSGSD